MVSEVKLGTARSGPPPAPPPPVRDRLPLAVAPDEPATGPSASGRAEQPAATVVPIAPLPDPVVRRSGRFVLPE